MAVKIDFPDGRSLELHLPSVGDHIKIVDFDYENSKRMDRLRFYLGLVENRLISKSWDGPVDELTPDELTHVFGQWLGLTEDDAVPPAPGSSSGTPLPEPRSRRRTASGSRSTGRASSKS